MGSNNPVPRGSSSCAGLLVLQGHSGSDEGSGPLCTLCATEGTESEEPCSSLYPDSPSPLCGGGRPEQVANCSHQGVPHSNPTILPPALSPTPPLYPLQPHILLQVLQSKRRERRSCAGEKSGATGGAGAARAALRRRRGSAATDRGGAGRGGGGRGESISLCAG